MDDQEEIITDAATLREWKTLSRAAIVDRRPWLHLWAEEIELPDGRIIPGFNTIEMPDVAVIVALTPDGQVVTERSYKHGAQRVCLSLPAGYVESGEDSLVAAQRELREETGYVADEWVSLGQFVNDGNRGCGTSHLFLARGAHQVAMPDAGDLEEIEVSLMPLDTVLHAARTGDVAILTIAAAIGFAVIAERDGWSAILNVPSDEVIEHVVYSHPCKPPFWSVH